MKDKRKFGQCSSRNDTVCLMLYFYIICKGTSINMGHDKDGTSIKIFRIRGGEGVVKTCRYY